MPIAQNITLNEKSHVYTNADGKIYSSVSSILGRYKEPFDAESIAKKQSAKTGKPVAEILAEWSASAPYGTAVHKQLEDFFKDKDGMFDLIKPYISVLSSWKSRDVEFYPEAILSIEELSIAGTSDLLVRDADDRWSIIDWKTNKSIYKNSFGGKRLASPLDHLEDCNFIHYSLQMSFYAVMLGLPIKKLSLVHIPKGQDTLTLIPCPFLEKEVYSILEQVKNPRCGLK